MAPQVTEMARITVHPGSRPEDPSTSEGKTLQEGLKILSSQPGYQRCRYGRQVEDETTLEWYIDWDDREDHKKFEESSAYPGFLDILTPLLAGPPTIYHAAIDPFPPTKVLAAPVTEVFTMYFAPSITEAEQSSHAQNVKQVAEHFAKIDGSRGLTGGWVLEELENEKIEGGKAKAFVALIGWDSVEAHLKGRESEAFKESIHFFTDAASVGDKAVFHVKFTEYAG